MNLVCPLASIEAFRTRSGPCPFGAEKIYPDKHCVRSAIRKADAVLPAFACAGQRGDTLKRVARRGRCRLLFRLGVQHI